MVNKNENRRLRLINEIVLVTGEEEGNESASPSKTTKGKPGRKPGRKGKNKNQEADNETGMKFWLLPIE